MRKEKQRWIFRKLALGFEIRDSESSIVVLFSHGQDGKTRVIVICVQVDGDLNVWYKGVVNCDDYVNQIDRVIKKHTKHWFGNSIVIPNKYWEE